ncbi:MAG: hypothetical protein ACO3JL_13890 [Myxococcota bacterium]
MPEDAPPTIKMVLDRGRETCAHYAGSIEQVAEGREARLSWGIEDGTDTAIVVVHPESSGFSVTARTELPERLPTPR